MKIKHTLAILIVLALMAVGLVVPTSAAAACTVQTSWPTYRIVAGDTLSAIAKRYGISTATLAAANCITNASLIYAGALIRVPSGPGTPLPGSLSIPVTFQQFEHGFMIWRSDTGDIWAYLGSSGGSVMHFLSRNYGALPDNPVQTPTPAGRVRPIFGFGRVWGNFANVRSAFGWATSGESSYIMLYTPISSSLFYFKLPDGRSAVTINSLSWNISSTPVPPPGQPTPTPTGGVSIVTVNAAYQLFENGFLLWRADSGRIDLFTKTYVAGYNLDQYATLPDNPVTDQPPPGRVKPINGFGRVWGNFVDTRNALGWGLGTEQGFVAIFKTDLSTNVICVNLPDGHFVSYPHYIGNRSWMWQYEASCG